MTTQPAGVHHAHKPGHIEGDHVVTVQVSCELLAQLHEWSDPVQAQIQHHSGLQPEYTMEFRTHTCPSVHHTGTLNLTGEGNAPGSAPGPAADLIEHAASIIVASRTMPHTAPGHWAGALWEAGMLVAPGTPTQEQIIRQQVAEEIAEALDDTAASLHKTAEGTRQQAIDEGSRSTYHGDRLMRMAIGQRNRAEGLRSGAVVAREIGAKA